MSDSLQPYGPQSTRLLCQLSSVTQSCLTLKDSGSGLPCPPPGDLPNPRIKPTSVLPALVSEFFTISTTWEPPNYWTAREFLVVILSWRNYFVCFTLILNERNQGRAQLLGAGGTFSQVRGNSEFGRNIDEGRSMVQTGKDWFSTVLSTSLVDCPFPFQPRLLFIFSQHLDQGTYLNRVLLIFNYVIWPRWLGCADVNEVTEFISRFERGLSRWIKLPGPQMHWPAIPAVSWGHRVGQWRVRGLEIVLPYRRVPRTQLKWCHLWRLGSVGSWLNPHVTLMMRGENAVRNLLKHMGKWWAKSYPPNS